MPYITLLQREGGQVMKINLSWSESEGQWQCKTALWWTGGPTGSHRATLRLAVWIKCSKGNMSGDTQKCN